MKSEETDPIRIINEIYKHPSVKMHGPEHHFLVPAVLLTSYYNLKGDKKTFKKKIMDAKQRSSNVLGGFCGYYGSCGSAIGSGIAMSLITNTTPLSRETWKQCNLTTAEALKSIALNGGPRCCKRDVYISIEEAVRKIKEFLDTEIPVNESISCGYSFFNKECIKDDCKYFDRDA
jgi:hypothetical protein